MRLAKIHYQPFALELFVNPNGKEDVIIAKWQSLTRRICNIHSGYGELFPKCMHPEFAEQCPQKKLLPPSKRYSSYLHFLKYFLKSCL